MREISLAESMLTHPVRTKSLPMRSPATILEPPCIFRQERAADVQCVCTSGRTRRMIPAYTCSIKGVCTVHDHWLPTDSSVALCRLCNYRQAEAKDRKLAWAVGVTTVLKRKSDLLPRTLTSLAKAGWHEPRLFVDGSTHDDWRGVKFPITVRESINALANWWLGMQELYVRNPLADRYMMVEDDVLFTVKARNYLDRVKWPGAGYLNLYTTPAKREASGGRQGFFQTPRHIMGLGALALVFDRDSITKILSSAYFVEAFRPFDLKTMKRKENPHRARMHQDGHVAKAMKAIGMSEFCHAPSIVQHLGGKSSTMGHNSNPDSDCFDENFDLEKLL